MRWRGEMLGSGFSPSSQDDDRSHPAFLLFYIGCLALWYLCQVIRAEGFFWTEYVDFKGSLQLLTSSHLRERDKMLLRAILCVGVWNGILLGKAKKEDVPCRFCGKRGGDVIFLGVHFLPPPCCMLGNFLSFHLL